MQKHNTSTTEKRIILILLTALSLSILFIIYYFWNAETDKPSSFFARSINDASYDCEDKISNQFGKKLINRNYDELSSRYDRSKRQYIIYYQLTVSDEEKGMPVILDLMAKCVVWERVGYVSDYSVFERQL